MEKITLKVQKRNELGRKVKNLRRDGIIPANIYGSGFKSKAVQVALKDFEEIFKKVGETTVVELSVDSEKALPVLIHNVQKNPISDLPIHVDFLKIDLKKKVVADVPLEISGEAPAEKQGLGTLVQYVDEIKVEALPGDLPEKIMVDVSSLVEVDQSIMIKNLLYDKSKIELKDNPEEVVVKIEVQKEEVVEVPPAAEGVAEGETPSEGETAAQGEVSAEEVEKTSEDSKEEK